MSSFDQSRGFGQPSGIHRQESWNASEGWNSFGSPPEPAARHHVIPATSSSLGSTNGFQHFASTAATDLAAAADDDDARAALLPRRELDYSVIDDDDDSGRPGGFDMHDCSDDNHNNRWRLPEPKKVSIHLGPQLEGSLLRKHHVWVVTCEQGGATERRYSDFVWLLDCLTRRYPFRLLPQLPPKSIQYQGHFIGQDEGFLDRRRRGLERCLNSLVNHPVVGKDAILSKFLNEPGVKKNSLSLSKTLRGEGEKETETRSLYAFQDLAAFRKNADNVSLVEESSTLTLSAAQLASLPATLDRRLDAVRSHLPLEIDAWTKLSVTVDRVAHRRLNQANEWTKLAAAFDHAVELELEAEQAGHPSSRLEPRSSSLSSPRTSGSRESGGGSTTTMINHHGRTRPVREEFVVAAHDDGSTSEGLGWRPREMKTLEKELGILSHGIRELSYENESSSKRLLEGFVEDVKRVSLSLSLCLSVSRAVTHTCD